MNNLIHPIIIHNTKLPSNVFFAPINPGFSKNGIISDKYYDFYNIHSGRGIGICYVGNVSLKRDWSSNDNTAVLQSTPEEYWKSLSSLITNNGSVPGIQLAWKPPQLVLQKAFTTHDIERQIDSFKSFYNSFDAYDSVSDLYISSIKEAEDCGFTVIQLHAAHGYALSILLSRSISGCNNPHETKGFKLIRKILNCTSQCRAIFDIRLSLYEGIQDGAQELEYKSSLVESLEHCGFDIISLSNGFYNVDKTMIYPAKNGTSPILAEAVNLARKHNNIIWNIAGNLEYALIDGVNLPQNLTVSLGRQLLADPEVIEKLMRHQNSLIRKCTECCGCHYYSFGYDGIQECKL